MNNESPLTFPCKFPVKVMGINHDRFESDMVMIVHQYVSDLGEGAVQSRLSRTGKYMSVTITITARSREQLDNLYQAFNDHPDVRMVL